MLFSFAIIASAVLTAPTNGKTYITDVCQSDDGCESGCCAFNTGKCAGPIIALERDGGCGFGSGTPNANAARAIGFTGAFPKGSQNTGSTQKAIKTIAINASAVISAPANGKTYITDVCQSDDGCESGCCAFNTGKCAGPIIALERDGGCGFGSGTPNANAARAMGFTGAFSKGSQNTGSTQKAIKKEEVALPVVYQSLDKVTPTDVPCEETPLLAVDGQAPEAIAPVVATPTYATNMDVPCEETPLLAVDGQAPEAIAPVVATPTYATTNPLATEATNTILINSAVSNSVAAASLAFLASFF
jgi:hypothetical protein